jgi:endoglucanase
MHLLTSLIATLIGTTNAVIRGINTFGLETEYMGFMCDWAHPIEWHIEKIASLGFNTLRIPFSHDFVRTSDFAAMDEIFFQAEKYDLNISLDFHRIHKTHQASKPYDEQVSFDQFLESWKIILARYEASKNLIYVDIFNEYQSDNYVEWNFLARQIVSYIEHEFPERFSFFVGGTVWGSDLHFVDLSDLPYKERIFYTIHTYWFNSHEPFEEWWDYHFGPYKNIVSVNEWGYISSNSNEVDFAERFVEWLISKDIHDSYFWSWSPNSGDTQGILKDDCTAVDENKMNLLKVLWAEKD